ncbi:BTB/POZ domain-containing protein [Rhizophagus clarus]|uniref:BTB/POZ domain-containing protein n=1 Tax=Rhizophagus clarus TaxID=94130 RepID=A0A8H3L3Y9_9GLOM|nr:BTB/POZ domain-containing protein [Rhizophagus clarus]
MAFEYSQEVCDDYEKLFEAEKGHDVIICAGEDENMKEIHAHSLILCTRSQYFCAAFYNDWVEKKDGIYTFKKPNISPQLFKIILRFIYCGKIDLTNLQGPEILKLLIAVDELNIQTLIICVQKHLINYKEFLQENFMEILQMVYHNELFIDLLDYCLEKIEILFDSDKFLSLEASLLEFLLKRDDLNLNEIKIWDGLIKWGLSQEELSQDISKWNKDVISILKRILCKFIPLIRFYEISSEDYINKVKPYEEILSKELREEILKFHQDPEYKPMLNLLPRHFVDSIIVNRKHITLFVNWINKGSDDPISYKFNLLYRASRDGNSAEAFHAKCDNKGATIVVVKIKNSEQIVGGYNPLFWNLSDSGKSTRNSFIFSFENKNDLQTAKVVYSYGSKYSIYCGAVNGPVFGCNDLYVNYVNHPDVWISTCTSCYPKLNIPRRMAVTDYEVFQVINRISST